MSPCAHVGYKLLVKTLLIPSKSTVICRSVSSRFVQKKFISTVGVSTNHNRRIEDKKPRSKKFSENEPSPKQSSTIYNDGENMQENVWEPTKTTNTMTVASIKDSITSNIAVNKDTLSPLDPKTDSDFFGIAEYDSSKSTETGTVFSESIIRRQDKVHLIQRKFDFLNPNREDVEKVIVLPYGVMRIDSADDAKRTEAEFLKETYGNEPFERVNPLNSAESKGEENFSGGMRGRGARRAVVGGRRLRNERLDRAGYDVDGGGKETEDKNVEAEDILARESVKVKHATLEYGFRDLEKEKGGFNRIASENSTSTIDGKKAEMPFKAPAAENLGFIDEQYFSSAIRVNGGGLAEKAEESRKQDSYGEKVIIANKRPEEKALEEMFLEAKVGSEGSRTEKRNLRQSGKQTVERLVDFVEKTETWIEGKVNSKDSQFRVERPSRDKKREVLSGTLARKEIDPQEDGPSVQDIDSRGQYNKSQNVQHEMSVNNAKKVPVKKSKDFESHQRPKAAFSENPATAYDMVMKLRTEQHKHETPEMEQRSSVLNNNRNAQAKSAVPREAKWSGRLDSHGYRNLTEQVQNLDYLPEDSVLQILKNCVIYEDEDMIAIDKPYGLPSHGGPGVHNSVAKFLKPLAKKVDKSGLTPTLYLVHRLDKETTGVMVLAKSEKLCGQLRGLFKKREVIKKYWVITKGIPNPEEGVIDIPLAEGEVGSKFRMALRPKYDKEMRLLANVPHSNEGAEAVTKYKVLARQDSGVALVECEPKTGLKHQIRCHLAFALNTPILGDHKYSHLSKMAPQKLFPEVLQALRIRQAKVRHLPMHLHAHSLVFPEFKEGRNVFIRAPLPRHFTQNMKWLKLQPDS